MAMPLGDELYRFLLLTRQYLGSLKIQAAPALEHTLREEIDALVLNWPHPRALTKPKAFRLPACVYLDQALENARMKATHGLCESVASLLPTLRWSYGYPSHPTWPSLPSRIAFAQIVGPNGLSDDSAVHLGLTLLAPHTHYPLHSHPAIELYLVLSGAALWRTSGRQFNRQQPGSAVLHPTNIGHAMETADEPLLALYTWRGDLATAPVYVEE